ncbi:hypothetical protein ES707_21157 [subsurface metagenome]
MCNSLTGQLIWNGKVVKSVVEETISVILFRNNKISVYRILRGQ